ncbi:hypothetical protein O9Z70_08630 [Devosia sp. YIM 151766]|uniref:spike base protein, RCAP_Rcc01079 family n=1 Tax=Devosia sp. YIM 151766 TaxID=3017325 RepID=UPI00255C392E|nr:hypothetical protein [Devosia sp. YIM 151766]WIY51555.1 hypothetical protein O9Z70_08630 [Devosia sp. YIM 151766]
MSDYFENTHSGLTSPASRAIAIAPDDNADLSLTTRAIYIGGGGDLTVTMRDGGQATFTGLAAGTLLPIRVRRVLEASTATQLVGLA